MSDNWTRQPDGAAPFVCGACWYGRCHRCTGRAQGYHAAGLRWREGDTAKDQPCRCAVQGHPEPATCPEMVTHDFGRASSHSRCGKAVRRSVELWGTNFPEAGRGKDAQSAPRCGVHARMHEQRKAAVQQRKTEAEARKRAELRERQQRTASDETAAELERVVADLTGIQLKARTGVRDGGRIDVDAEAAGALLRYLQERS